MKSKFLSTISIVPLALVVLAVVQITACQPAMAQNARFNFAPNVYKVNTPRGPRSSFVPRAQHTVSHGSVPKGSTFLGITPSLLSSPAGEKHIAARPTMTAGNPAIMPSKQVKASARSGGSRKSTGAQVASRARAGKLPARRAVRKRKSSRHSHSVRKRHQRKVAKPMIANYGNSRHYQKGSFTAGATRTQTRVSGTVIKH